MSVIIEASYDGELHCTATHGPSGRTLTTDAPTDNGGKGESFSPTDLVATGLATCVLTICGLISRRHGVDLAGTRVRVEKEMVNTPHRRIGRLVTVVTLPADLQLEEAMRKRLEIGAGHCPVHQSLHPDIDAPIVFETA